MAGNCQRSPRRPVEWVKGKVVGSGSFGTVHLAMDKASGGLFVVKSVESEFGIQSLENEASILESLDSPYIVKFLVKNGSVRADGGKRLNLFIEYMAGGSLHDVAEMFGGALDEKVIRSYTKAILQGLKYLHENGIVHSDVKCKNVLLGSCGNIKLADFGCAKQVGDWKSLECSKLPSKSVGGTPLWMAPEALRNEGLDFAADIWSLGCTVIEMATRMPPWGNDISNPMAAILKIACSNKLPKFPAYFSPEGLDFLGKCLYRNPEERPTAEELLYHPFIAGSSYDKHSRSKESCSPTSVFDLETCRETDDFDLDQPSNGDEFISKNPFTMRSHCKDEAVTPMSPETWITVRSSPKVA